MYQKSLKRVLDFSISLIALVLLIPIFLILALAVALLLGENPIFYQKRTGYKGAHFSILKFKTMKTIRSDSGVLLHDDLRTNIGTRILRKLNLDELPQLLNILKGDMSFIGPRPLPIRYESNYTSEQFNRHIVRPGITGLAQIYGRRSVSWKNRIQLDLLYCQELSFLVDVKILFNTFKVFFDTSKSEFGLEQDPETYMPNFDD